MSGSEGYAFGEGRPKVLRTPPPGQYASGGGNKGDEYRSDEVVPETPLAGPVRRPSSRKRNDSSSTDEETVQLVRPKKQRRRADEEEETVLVSPRSAATDLGDIRKMQTEESMMEGDVRLAIDEAMGFIRGSTNTNKRLKEMTWRISEKFAALENHRTMIERRWSSYVRALKVAAVKGQTAVVRVPQVGPVVVAPRATKESQVQTASEMEKTEVTTQTSPHKTYAEAIGQEGPKAGSSGEAALRIAEINRQRAKNLKFVDRETTDAAGTETEGEWQRVRKRRQKSKVDPSSGSEGTTTAANVRRRPRPEAVLIKLKGENGMEEVLRRVRKVDMTGVSTRIEGITKTRTGDILLRVERGAGKAAPVLNTIKAAITDREVMLLEENCKLAVRDLDAVTTKEEVLEAILRVEPKARCRMKTMVETERGQMVAYVFVDRKTADAITRAGFLRVGLTSCRVRVLAEQARCIRCWEVGHIAAKCTGVDRSRMCFKCGKAGHQVRECAGENECFVCEGVQPGTGKGHRAYTTGCPHDKRRVGVAPNPVVKEVTLVSEGEDAQEEGRQIDYARND
uniref:CCHC-type domain-containing protein n=1 Tax=Photinus pyralis TaxID=7054 RepID=A0A1Y1N116_PHOPY